jgi:hypothetical protein
MITSEFPKVTVLMPVFNGEAFLHEAINSILAQTFTNFEFLIIDDGSTDRSLDIIDSYNDPRIRMEYNNNNLGLVATLNRGIDLSLGTYIARMDCDDVSLPTRLEKQVAFMDEHPEVGVCSAWVKVIGNASQSVWNYPLEPEVLKCWLLFESVLPHPAAILRTKTFRERNLYYNSSFPHAEDYELWVRAAKKMSLMNIGEVLLLYRLHENNVGLVYSEGKMASASRIHLLQLLELGITPLSEEMDIHQQISCWHFSPDKLFVEQVEKWLCKLKEANMVTNIYPEPAFSLVLAERWVGACEAATINGYWTFNKFYSSPLFSFVNIRRSKILLLFLKCLCGMVRSI